jgi:cytochrome d ubiquinol oxidase subunit I
VTNLILARTQMAYSLGFHMIFAALGVGMPLLMLLAEGLWLKTRQERYLKLAKTWAKATGVLFAIGAVSGTALSFEMGLLWPRFMAFAGATIGPAFALEGFAFFLEAIFLGLYLYGWERLSPLAHWLCGGVVAIAGAASSALVVASNGWMQNPIGADLLRTNPAAMDVVGVLFRNPAWPIMTVHSTISTYAATGFAVAGIYAWGALRGRTDALRLTALKLALAVGVLAALVMPVTGDASAKAVAVRQPSKLAAMESQFATERRAPLRIGGIPDVANRKVYLSVEIPGGLSWLSFGDRNAEVKGLEAIPRADWPNVPVTHIAFQVMVAAGTVMPVVAFWYFWLLVKRGRESALRPWPLRALLVTAPLGFVALEAGWVVTEVGRQPWMIYQVMRTADAVTPAAGLPWAFAAFLTLYALLGTVLVLLLNRLRHASEGGT